MVASFRTVADNPPPESDTPLDAGGRRRIAVSASLALLFLLSGVALLGAADFRARYFPVPIGTVYPSWYRPTLPVLADGIDDGDGEATIERCARTASESLFCKLSNEGKGLRSAQEKAIVHSVIAKDRSTTYCDDFLGECRPQSANISLSDASQLVTYLKYRYLVPASADLERGRLERARTAIGRMGYLLQPVDLPLSSDYCCDDSDMMLIAPAFLSGKTAWRDRQYARRVFSLGVESRRFETDDAGRAEPSGFPDIDAYAEGLEANRNQCRRTAARKFQQLALADPRRMVRELAAYMALRTRFIDRLRGNGECVGERAVPLSDEEAATLESLVSRPGFLSDIRQMNSSASSGD